MKIERIESWHDEHVGFVRVTDADGATGMGQMSPYLADATAVVFRRLVAPAALGADVGDEAGGIETLIDSIYRENYKFPGTFLLRALGGLDTALWDLAGRRAGRSVCALCGGEPRGVPVYASSMRRDVDAQAEAARFGEWRDAAGVRGFKFKVGMPVGRDREPWPGRTEQIVERIGAEFGDADLLIADANGGFSERRAIEVGHLLERHGIGWFEEPCPFWEIDATAAVRRALRVGVCGGEQDYDVEQWRRLLDAEALGMVQPDIQYVGGFSRARRVAALAAAAGKPCMPHSANRSMVLVFSLHLIGCAERPGPAIEFGIDEPAWAAELYFPTITVADGAARVPEGPGWGVEVNLDRLAGMHYEEFR